MKYLRLTHASDTETYVNFDKVIEFFQTEDFNKKQTLIKMVDSSPIRVKESAETIMLMLIKKGEVIM